MLACAAAALALVALPRHTASFPELGGVLRPARVVRVGCSEEAVVSAVLVRRGDAVESGQLLAELDMGVQEAEAALLRAQSRQTAAIRAAELELQRLEDKLADHQALFEDGILSSEDLRETRGEKELAEHALTEERERRALAELAYRRALAVLARGRVVSPLAGVVTVVNRSPGELAFAPGALPIAEVAELDPLAVEVTAPLELYGRVQEGQAAEVVVTAPFETSRAGEVVFVDRMVDPVAGRFTFRIELDNPGSALPAGLPCRVRLLP